MRLIRVVPSIVFPSLPQRALRSIVFSPQYTFHAANNLQPKELRSYLVSHDTTRFLPFHFLLLHVLQDLSRCQIQGSKSSGINLYRYPIPSRKAGIALVTPVRLRVYMGGGSHLLADG
ncbi:hypothetical protein EVAR_31839_1 [Eumeta japonica]|uniref:Uncharacterized protein n=1 Tax=Eumeta variegata TaxID=151549 RepID=A0A4C1WLX0_EUMVA|nr:hypothetical protein EVAR_31839_1 [Eumeta japonica]